MQSKLPKTPKEPQPPEAPLPSTWCGCFAGEDANKTVVENHSAVYPMEAMPSGAPAENSKFATRSASSAAHANMVSSVVHGERVQILHSAPVSTPPRGGAGQQLVSEFDKLSDQLRNLTSAVQVIARSQDELKNFLQAELEEVRRDVSTLHFTVEGLRVAQTEAHAESDAQEPSEAFESRLASCAKHERRGPSQRVSHVARLATIDPEYPALLPVWKVGNCAEKPAESGFAMVRKDSFDKTDQNLSWFESKVILHPDSLKRLLWDTCSALLVVYDIIVLPMSFLNMQNVVFFDLMAWTSRLFWTCDMLFSIITGYTNKDATVERRFRKIVTRYCFTWLLLDLIIVGVDWMELAGGDEASDVSALRTGKASRASKIFRLVRMLRLLRLLRVGTSILSMSDRIATERLVVLFYIGVATLGILAMSHMVACFWYGIGDTDDGWVARHRDALGLEQLDADYGYLTALHWALTQFAGHMDELPANTASERLFADIVKVISLDLWVLIICGISALLVRLSILAMDDETRLAKLRQFLKCNQISSSLVQKVQRSANYGAMRARQQMSEADIEILPFVADDLLLQLHYEVRAPFLVSHSLFDVLKLKVPQLLRRLCHSTMSDSIFERDQYVFHVHEKPKDAKMYFVMSGDLRYVSSGTVTVLEEQEWVAEMVLWMDWTHRGTLRTLSRTRLFAISAKDFQAIAGEYHNPNLKLKRYAKTFVQTLMALPETMLNDLSHNNEEASTAVVWEELDRSPKKFRKTALPFK